MSRSIVAAILAACSLLAPVASPGSAAACGVVRAAVDVKAELAAIKKALPKAKLNEADYAKVKKVIAAGKPNADQNFASELADAMKLLKLNRIFRSQACLTIKVPIVVG